MNKNNPKKITNDIIIVLGLIFVTIIIIFGCLYFDIQRINKTKNNVPNLKEISHNNNNDYLENQDEFQDYMRNMQINIKKNWNPPKNKTNAKVILSYKIAKDGSLISYSIYKSSGNKKIDKAAIYALKQAAPFGPLPAKYNKDSIDVQFTFDYKVHKNKNK